MCLCDDDEARWAAALQPLLKFAGRPQGIPIVLGVKTSVPALLHDGWMGTRIEAWRESQRTSQCYRLLDIARLTACIEVAWCRFLSRPDFTSIVSETEIGSLRTLPDSKHILKTKKIVRGLDALAYSHSNLGATTLYSETLKLCLSIFVVKLDFDARYKNWHIYFN